MSSESHEGLNLITPAGERRTKAAPRRKARPQPQIHAKYSLLTVPYEIRNQILHWVLTSPSSCLRRPEDGFPSEVTSYQHSLHKPSSQKSKNDTTVYPAVLRSCKQLCNEGLPILYRNTFGMDLYVDEYDDRLEFQGYDLSDRWENIPYKVRQQFFKLVRKLHVIIHVDGQTDQGRPPIDTEESSQHMVGISMLCERLWQMPNLASMHLTIAVQNKHQLANDNDIGEQILKPLTLLSNVGCVSITGVSLPYAESLKRVMESCGHVHNLFAMRLALATYLGDEYYENEGWNSVREAVSECDVELFNERRSQIVARTESQAAARRERLYTFD